MPPRLSLKPDASFFRKITVGAIGARQVVEQLNALGHQVVELERGALDTKLWKDVKRKRVRIPDLVCLKCGQRIECRAKSKTELTMSHSPTAAERAWDYGLVNSDWVAFPVCLPVTDLTRSSGRLRGAHSYWRERNWISWEVMPHVNYFTAAEFRGKLFAKRPTKSGTEGAETFIEWPAVFSTVSGTVEPIDPNTGRIKVKPADGGRVRSWGVSEGAQVVVSAGDRVMKGQVIASPVRPVPPSETICPCNFGREQLSALLQSRERTQRFTGVKMARLLSFTDFESVIGDLASDEEEDIYVRLEAVSYLASVCQKDAAKLFLPFLNDGDEQTKLEAVIALGEARSPAAIDILAQILSAESHPLYLRSAAAWSLAQTGDQGACKRLVEAFGDVDLNLRQDALEYLVAVGATADRPLLDGLVNENTDIAAGCAEAIRQKYSPDSTTLPTELVPIIKKAQPDAVWPVWLAGQFPASGMKAAVASLQESHPDLHFAITLLWSFLDSWIARDWEVSPNPKQSGV